MWFEGGRFFHEEMVFRGKKGGGSEKNVFYMKEFMTGEQKTTWNKNYG